MSVAEGARNILVFLSLVGLFIATVLLPFSLLTTASHIFITPLEENICHSQKSCRSLSLHSIHISWREKFIDNKFWNHREVQTRSLQKCKFSRTDSLFLGIFVLQRSFPHSACAPLNISKSTARCPDKFFFHVSICQSGRTIGSTIRAYRSSSGCQFSAPCLGDRKERWAAARRRGFVRRRAAATDPPRPRLTSSLVRFSRTSQLVSNGIELIKNLTEAGEAEAMYVHEGTPWTRKGLRDSNSCMCPALITIEPCSVVRSHKLNKKYSRKIHHFWLSNWMLSCHAFPAVCKVDVCSLRVVSNASVISRWPSNFPNSHTLFSGNRQLDRSFLLQETLLSLPSMNWRGKVRSKTF